MSLFRPRRRLVLVVLAAILALGEIVAHLVGLPDLPRDPTFTTAPEWRFPDWIAKDPELFWKFRPNRVIEGRYRINNHGYRGPDFTTEKTPGVMRVVCLGESNTFGLRLPDNVVWPAKLQVRLNELDPQHRNWEVLNLAVTDYSSLQGLRLANREVARLKPDIVLYCFAWADHQMAANATPDYKINPGSPTAIAVENFMNQIGWIRWSKRAWSAIFPPDPPSPNVPGIDQRRVSSTDYEDNIEKIARVCVAAGARAILLTSPISWPPRGMTDVSGVFDVHHRYRRLARYGAVAGGAEFVELANVFDEHAEFYDDPRRENEFFNAKGHAFAADFLARYILGDTAIVNHYGSASAIDKE